MQNPTEVRCKDCGSPGHLAPDSPVKQYICPRCLPRELPRIIARALLPLLFLGCTGIGMQVDREDAAAVMQVVCERVQVTPKDPLLFRIAWNLACLQVKK